MSAARSRAEAAWGVEPAVVGQADPDAGNRPGLDDVVPGPTPTPPFGLAWAEFEARSAEELRETLRLDERLGWAEELSGGVVRYPAGVERPWVRAVEDDDEG